MKGVGGDEGATGTEWRTALAGNDKLFWRECKINMLNVHIYSRKKWSRWLRIKINVKKAIDAGRYSTVTHLEHTCKLI